MRSKIAVSFKIPNYALKVLEMIETQNSNVGFDLDKENGILTVKGELLDFYEFSDDWDNLNEYENYLKGVE